MILVVKGFVGFDFFFNSNNWVKVFSYSRFDNVYRAVITMLRQTLKVLDCFLELGLQFCSIFVAFEAPNL